MEQTRTGKTKAGGGGGGWVVVCWRSRKRRRNRKEKEKREREKRSTQGLVVGAEVGWSVGRFYGAVTGLIHTANSIITINSNKNLNKPSASGGSIAHP